MTETKNIEKVGTIFDTETINSRTMRKIKITKVESGIYNIAVKGTSFRYHVEKVDIYGWLLKTGLYETDGELIMNFDTYSQAIDAIEFQHK